MTTRAAAIKHGYTTGARSLASRSVTGLIRTRITPNMLTATGVSLCVLAAVIVLFENQNEILFYWLAAVVFVIGSLLDILDGALARAGGKTTPFGAFLDSTTDRVGDVLADLALDDVERRHDLDVVDVVPAEVDVHQSGDEVVGIGVPVVGEALHERVRAVADADDRDAHLLLLTPAGRVVPVGLHYCCASISCLRT